MQLLEWNEKLRVGISEIDAQHQELVKIYNEVVISLQNEDHSSSVQKILQEMIEYAEMHFRSEEFLLQQNNYPDISSQIDEHNEFRNRIELFSQKNDHDPALMDELLVFLGVWIVNHIMGTDMKYKNFFAELGVY